MTGQAERSTKNKQPSRSKGRGWNCPNKQSNVGTPEAEPSWTSLETYTLEAEPSWTPWLALATPWEMGHNGALFGANMSQHGPTWDPLGAFLGPTWANRCQLGPTGAKMRQLGANLTPTWSQLGADLPQHGPTWGQLGANSGFTRSQLESIWTDSD